MSDAVVKKTRCRQLHYAALVAMLVPAGLLAGCAEPAPPPPPQPPQAVYTPAPAPMPAPPARVPYVRG